MWLKVKDRICKGCGCMGGIFFAQKQRKIQVAINNICKECKAIERSEYYYKHEKYQRYMKDVREKR